MNKATTKLGSYAGALEHTQAQRKSMFEERQETRPNFEQFDWFVVESNIKCEAKAAQNMHEAGFAVYLPKLKFEAVHHRTKKKLEKTANLFRQYLFVGLPKREHNWFKLRRCEGVKWVLGVDEPMTVSTAQVAQFWQKEHDLQFDSTKQAKIHRGETLQKQFPKGHMFKHRIADVPFLAKVESVSARGVITAMVEMMGSQTRLKIRADTVARVDRAA